MSMTRSTALSHKPNYQCVYCRGRQTTIGELLFHERSCSFKPYAIATWQRDMSQLQRMRYHQSGHQIDVGGEVTFYPNKAKDQ